MKSTRRADDHRQLPLWALEAMLVCARGAHRESVAVALESALNERFLDASEDTLWYAHFPMVMRAVSRDLTAQGTWQKVDEACLQAIFGEAGDLAQRFERYEPRAGQVAMAHAVLKALNQQQFLLAEAGTGVGKSLAYLVPCALWACQNNLPIVLSTNTRNLQSQLLLKDIPLVQRILARHLPEGHALNAVVLKGRNNYLCLKRFGAFLESGFEGLSDDEVMVFADLIAWAAKTKDGDFDTFRPIYSNGDMNFVHRLGCRAEACTGKKCQFYKRCFLQQARQNAIGADLVIANHALIFAELENPGTLLPPHAQIVFDEAHNLEAAATSFLTMSMSPLTFYDLCQTIAPSKGREAGSLYQQLRIEFIDGHIQSDATRATAVENLANLRKHGVALAKAGTELFETLSEVFKSTPHETIRYRRVPDAEKPSLPNGQPQMRRELNLSGKTFIPAEDVLAEADLQACRDKIAKELDACVVHLEAFETMMTQLLSEKEREQLEDLSATIEKAKDDFDSFAETLDVLLSGENPDQVYWLERGMTKDAPVHLQMAPLDIAHQLKVCLYDLKASIIFSSATLRIATDFAHIRRRLGLALVEDAKRVVDFVAESPFDYPNQCSVVVPDYLPEVESSAEYALELSRLMYRLFVTAKGRSLALFTSYEMMRRCAETLQPHLRAKGIELLVQSAGMGREAMTERFRAQDCPTVLFGTQSFWEGVDVVGDALSCVVIARLPFESIGDPILQARSEKITRNGGSPFMELSLPQALIRFRQGFGRLIRSRSDRGIVVVADNRIVRKSYGTNFANTLPVSIAIGKTSNSIVQRLHTLLQRP